VSPSSPGEGLRTSRRLRRLLLKIYGPPDVSVVARCRSTDLPVSPSSSTSAEGRRSRTYSSSINPTFQVALLLGGYSTSASVRCPLFSTSPRPTGSTLPSHLHSISLWSPFRPSLKVCWLHLIPVRSAILQAMTAPCLHLKPLDLLSRDLMYAFIRAQEDFLFVIPVHPMRLHRCHVFASHRRHFVSTASPTRRL
jgi:hypothetical protein